MAEGIDLEVLETLLDAKISPLVVAIQRLERAQESMVEILQNQARQDVEIVHLQNENLKNYNEHNDLYTRIRAAEDKAGNRIWDVAKLVIASGVGAVITGLLLGG